MLLSATYPNVPSGMSAEPIGGSDEVCTRVDYAFPCAGNARALGIGARVWKLRND